MTKLLMAMLVLVMLIGCTESSAPPAPTEELTNESVPTAVPESTPTPEPAIQTISNGSFEVGFDVTPGQYRSAGPEAPFPLCSFARLKTAGASYADLEQVIDIQNVEGPAIVNIAASDGGFFSQGCQTWELRGTESSAAPAPEPAIQTISNGSFEVGFDVTPGQYRSAGPEAPFPLCSFARLKTAGASYADLEQVIDIQNVEGPAIVNIAASDGGFFSQGCQTWELRG